MGQGPTPLIRENCPIATVNNDGLMSADMVGQLGVSATLQSAYNNGASILLNAINSLQFKHSNGDNAFLVDTSTGKVTIAGKITAGDSAAVLANTIGFENVPGQAAIYQMYPTSAALNIAMRRMTSSSFTANSALRLVPNLADASLDFFSFIVNAGTKWGIGALQESHFTNQVFTKITAPTVTVGAAAGSGASVVTQANDGDNVMRVAVTTGTGCAAGILATITFVTAYARTVIPVITPANAATAALSGSTAVYPGTPLAGGANMTLDVAAALTDGTTYAWWIHCFGR